jgi:hypothetical protein
VIVRRLRAACAIREQAGRETSIEINMLVNRVARGWHQDVVDSASARSEASKTLFIALTDAQELLDRIGQFVEWFPRELERQRSSAKNSDDYERITSLELEVRDIWKNSRNEAKFQTIEVGTATLNAT